MASMSKVILYVITVFIITAATLPIDIADNDQSKHLYVNEEFTQQRVDDSCIFIRNRKNNSANDLKWVDFDDVRNKYEENRGDNKPGHNESKGIGVITPHTSLDDCVSEDDVISEIFEDNVSLDGTHTAALHGMQTGYVDKELNESEDVSEKSKISINEVLLSRLPFMEEDINKRDTNEELHPDENDGVETKTAKDFKVEHNGETSDSHVNKQGADIAIISLENKDFEPLAIGPPVVENHYGLQKAVSPDVYLKKHVDTEYGFEQDGRKAPSTYETETEAILPKNINVDDAFEVIFDNDSLDNIFGKPEMKHITREEVIEMENDKKKTDESLDQSENFIMKILESYPDFKENTNNENKVEDIGSISPLSGDIYNEGIHENITSMNYSLNDSNVNAVKNIDERSESLPNTPRNDNLLLPSDVVDSEDTNESMIIDNEQDVLHDLSQSTVANFMSGVEKIPEEYYSNRKSIRLEIPDDSTDAIEHPKPRDGTRIEELEPVDGVILVNTTDSANKKDLEENSTLNANLPNSFVMSENHKPINKIIGDFEQKREVPIEIQLAKEELHVQEDYQSPMEKPGPEEETLVEDNNVPNEVNLERELNSIREEEINNLSEPPIEIQMAREELHVRAEEERPDFSHITNNTFLLEGKNRNNRSCSSAEIDMFKDSFYHDELEEDFVLACLGKDILNTDDIDVYDEIPLVDTGLIAHIIFPIKSGSDSIARAVVPADIQNIADHSRSTIASGGGVDNNVPTNLPVVPVRPAPNLQGKNFPNYFQALPVNLQGLFLRNQNQNSGENTFNRRQRISWRDIMQLLLRPNYSNQGISRTQVPYTVRPNQALPVYPSNELNSSLPRNTVSQNNGRPQISSTDKISSNAPISRKMNSGQPLNQVRTVFPETIADPSLTDLPQPELNQDIRRSPIITNVNQQPQDFNGGIFSRLGTGVLRGIGGLFGAFRNGQPNNSWFG